jgi:hypothetical protein
MRANRVFRFQHDDLAPGKCQCPRNRESDYACADYRNINLR